MGIPLPSPVDKANSYIFADKIKKAKDVFIKTNGKRVGQIRGPFNNTEFYLYY